jgi:hypothetical protein
MKNRKKLLEKLRNAEAELVYATPKRAAKLSQQIVRWKWSILNQ